jgi:hypothetical protein
MLTFSLQLIYWGQTSIGKGEDTVNTSAEETSNGQQAFATLGQFLEDDGWHPRQLEERTAYRTGFAGQNSQMACYAQVVVEQELFLFYALAPFNVPEDARIAVAEFITRANYGMRIGNFELDFRDGEVRYKSSLDFEGTTLTPALIKHAIYPAVLTMDRYMPGLMGVAHGGKSPAEAIAEIEGE